MSITVAHWKRYSDHNVKLFRHNSINLLLQAAVKQFWQTKYLIWSELQAATTAVTFVVIQESRPSIHRQLLGTVTSDNESAV